MIQRSWPSDYPKHIDVPAKDAVQIDESLFRLVDYNPPTLYDFQASYKHPRQISMRTAKNLNRPTFYATSFFNDYNRVEHILQSLPERFKGCKIAFGHVSPNLGLGVYGDRNHVSVWFYEGVYPEGFVIL